MKKIIDDEPLIKASYIKLVFFRSERVMDLNLISWVKLWLIELLFGVEILEQCQITSIYNDGLNKKHVERGHMWKGVKSLVQ